MSQIQVLKEKAVSNPAAKLGESSVEPMTDAEMVQLLKKGRMEQKSPKNISKAESSEEKKENGVVIVPKSSSEKKKQKSSKSSTAISRVPGQKLLLDALPKEGMELESLLVKAKVPTEDKGRWGATHELVNEKRGDKIWVIPKLSEEGALRIAKLAVKGRNHFWLRECPSLILDVAKKNLKAGEIKKIEALIADMKS